MTDPMPPAASGDTEALPTRDVVASEQPMLFAVAGTHHGKTREANQDTFLCEAAGEFGLYAAIDGVGGYAGGHVAATLARDRIRSHVGRLSSAPEELLREAVLNANNAIVERSESDPALAQMACVLTVALVDPQQQRLYAAHVGDTRLYHRHGDAITKLTPDHSFVGLREDAGQISEEEAMRHPRRNEILRDVGSERRTAADPDFVFTTEVAFQDGDALLLCSDGLTDLVPGEVIRKALVDYRGNPQHAVNALVFAALEAGGTDNVTVVVAEYSASGARAGAPARGRSTNTMEFPPDAFGAASGAKRPELPTAPPRAARSPVPASRGVPMWVKGAIGALLVILLAGVGYILFNRLSGDDDATPTPEASGEGVTGAEPSVAGETTTEGPTTPDRTDEVASLIARTGPDGIVRLVAGQRYIVSTLLIPRDLVVEGNGATLVLEPDASYVFDVAPSVGSLEIRDITVEPQTPETLVAVLQLQAPEARVVLDRVTLDAEGATPPPIIYGPDVQTTQPYRLRLNPLPPPTTGPDTGPGTVAPSAAPEPLPSPPASGGGTLPPSRDPRRQQ